MEDTETAYGENKHEERLMHFMHNIVDYLVINDVNEALPRRAQTHQIHEQLKTQIRSIQVPFTEDAIQAQKSVQ